MRLRAVPGAPPLGAILGGAAGLAAAAVSLLRLDALPFTLCYFKAITGLPCLSCGSTRAFGRLAAGDLASAIALNPLATTAALALAAWAVADLALLPRRRALGVTLSPGAWRVVRVAAPALLLVNWGYLLAAGR